MTYETAKIFVLIFCGFPLVLVLISFVSLWLENRKKK